MLWFKGSCQNSQNYFQEYGLKLIALLTLGVYYVVNGDGLDMLKYLLFPRVPSGVRDILPQNSKAEYCYVLLVWLDWILGDIKSHKPWVARYKIPSHCQLSSA